jgi:hypothetical protein
MRVPRSRLCSSETRSRGVEVRFRPLWDRRIAARCRS